MSEGAQAENMEYVQADDAYQKLDDVMLRMWLSGQIVNGTLCVLPQRLGVNAHVILPLQSSCNRFAVPCTAYGSQSATDVVLNQ